MTPQIFQRPDLVIFDCDGVLVDSEPLSIRVLADYLHTLGFDITLAECYRDFLGRSLTSMQTKLTEKFGRTVTDAQLGEMREQLYALYRQDLLPIPGIAQTLQSLVIPFCVASSSQPDRIKFSLELTGLDHFFTRRMFSATMVDRGKPAPDLFLLAAARMGAPPETCVVIEDSLAGLEAANAANMTALAFVGGSHATAAGLREAVAEFHPYAIFDHMQDLPSLLAKLGER